MKKSVPLMLVMTLFCLSLLQGGCFKLPEGGALGNERVPGMTVVASKEFY